tara:strand:- start:5014 stop:6102 length:1089 start_codon:yes stop_codon:yes gene_type:complete
MKIAILGTRGIPNHYGGFEQFAQYISYQLVENNHEVFVYNSHNHPYKNNEWKGVKIIHCYDPEYKIGTFGQFIYDFNCIIDSRKREFDVILQLGYASSSIWQWLFHKDVIIISNMDGIEWKRSKYSSIVRRFLLFAERIVVKSSHFLIADSIGIKDYYRRKYGVDAKYIPYGSDIRTDLDESILDNLKLEKNNYNILIARMVPENNIEIILESYENSSTEKKLILVGDYNNSYGKYIRSRFTDSRIIYTGYISSIEKLDALRKYSNIYFHGHSVGGTNPSLLEAMSSNCFIFAHENEFNRSILGEDALYFCCKRCIIPVLNSNDNHEKRDIFISNNLKKIKNKYLWKYIVSDYEKYIVSSKI